MFITRPVLQIINIHCIARIERIADRADWWKINIVPNHVCFRADVTVQDSGFIVQATGHGSYSAVAAWEAFGKVEDLLRESRALRETARIDLAAS